ncbi:MAG: hypothetical protein ABEI86_12525, partial [Halobacteriaceae archaeon]
DTDKAARFLANLAAENGEYWPSPSIAGQAVLGLDAIGELDRIDTDATKAYIQENQYGNGGFADRAFFFTYLSYRRNAGQCQHLIRWAQSH